MKTISDVLDILERVRAINEATYPHDEETGARILGDSPISGADVVDMLSELEDPITDLCGIPREDIGLTDGDYVLTDGAVWLTVKKHFAVRVLATDEGVMVDIYQNGRELDNALGSTYVFDTDIEDEDETVSDSD